MAKKHVRILLIITISMLILVTTLFTSLCIYKNHIGNVAEFDLSDFECYIDEFNSEYNIYLGYIPDAKTAKEKVKVLWDDYFKDININQYMPFKISYDNTTKTWLVSGTSPFNTDCSFIPITILKQGTGKVLVICRY